MLYGVESTVTYRHRPRWTRRGLGVLVLAALVALAGKPGVARGDVAAIAVPPGHGIPMADEAPEARVTSPAAGSLRSADGPGPAPLTAPGPEYDLETILAAGSGTDNILDVTGYFVAGGSGASYVPTEPTRLLDSRIGVGLAGPFAASLPRTLQIAGTDPIPGDALAITVNLTVTAQTSAGYVSLTPLPTASPSTSSLNVPRGDTRANGLTVPLAPDGSLAAVWKGTPGRDYPGFDSRYHNEWEVIATIRQAEIDHPDIVDVFTVGRTHEGRDVWMAKVSDNVTIDENEPEVFVDALHHAREHLTVEQALYLFETLTNDYDSNTQVRNLVDSRETWIIFALNPDGWNYDLGGSPYRGWRKNRQPNSGTSAVGTDPNRNYDYKWACCGGSSGNKAAWNYRGPKPFSSQEARIVRNFVNGRVVNGKQQIRTHVTLHTNGELILYPPGYTKTDVPSGMPLDDQRTFVAMARAMAGMNGYRAQQSSDLYITDGDQIDWMYFRHRIFSFTFELYPTEQVSSHADHEPPDEVIAAQTARNRTALLYLMQMAACPWSAIGKQATYCP